MEFACPMCREPNATYFPDVPCTSWKRTQFGRTWCCEVCQSYDEQGLTHSMNDNRLDRILKDQWKHIRTFHRREKLRSHVGNGAPQGAFAFTLTKSPTDDLTEEDMIKAAEKVMKQQSCPVKTYAWYLEYADPTTKEHPHIHGMYETESLGRIEAKHWKRAWPIWDEKQRLGSGFRGGYHRPVRDEENYFTYIAKQNGTCGGSKLL